jgi:hypothetical protein
MFHVLQDSFSPAHTCRVKANRHGSEFALLQDVYNYSEQPDKKKHASLDGFPNWLKQIAQGKGHKYANDPVEVGAWLIAAVDKKLEWSAVEAHLKDTVFASVSEAPSEQGLPCIDSDL